MVNNKRNAKFAERQWYKTFALHFGVISGFLTILGLIYGIISYHQTVKPLVDEKNLKEQIKYLDKKNNDLDYNNIILTKQKSILEKDLDKLEKKKDNLENDLQKKEEKLIELQDEIIMANADAYMSPIYNDFLFKSIYLDDSNLNIKEVTLNKLQELSSESGISETQSKTLHILRDFTNEELNKSSDYNDLLNYRIYIFTQQLNEKGIYLDEKE